MNGLKMGFSDSDIAFELREGKHTPGPWEVTDEDMFSMSLWAIYSDSEAICHVESWSDMDEKTQEEAKANARLIAAAPELLKALKALIPIANGLDNLEEAWGKELDAGAKAIAKAEGKA